VVAAILVNSGKKHRVGYILSVKVSIKIVTHTIPNTIRITFFAMVVFAIVKATLVGHGFL
jgi:hypothetical protein